jgi:hypothetical protein
MGALDVDGHVKPMTWLDGDTCSPAANEPAQGAWNGGNFQSLQDCCRVKTCVFPEQGAPSACQGVKVDCHPRHGALTFGEDCTDGSGAALAGEALESCCMHRFNLSSGRARQGYEDPHPFPKFCGAVVKKLHDEEQRGDPDLPPE